MPLRTSFVKFKSNAFDNTDDVVVHISVPETEHPPSLALQKFSSVPVPVLLARDGVGGAVDFDGQFAAAAREVEDVAIDWMLSPAAETQHLSCAQAKP